MNCASNETLFAAVQKASEDVLCSVCVSETSSAEAPIARRAQVASVIRGSEIAGTRGAAIQFRACKIRLIKIVFPSNPHDSRLALIENRPHYEFEHNPGTDGGSAKHLRKQGYWAALSGAAGQVYGSAYTWRLANKWQTKLDTPGAIQLGYMKELLSHENGTT